MTKRITKLALGFVIAFFMTSLTFAQTPGSDEAETRWGPTRWFPPQLQFIGQEQYEVNGFKGTGYKLSVRNRSDHPDFFWLPSGKPCGANENSSRALVEVFGSPGDKRLAGFCSLRSSEELSQIWFPVQAGEKGPQCVYIVMTDQKTGKKYKSNQTCSRSFTVVRGRLSGGQLPAPARDHGWIEVGGFQIAGTAENNAQLGSGDSNRQAANSNRTRGALTSLAVDPGDSKAPANKRAGMAQPDLRIRQFLFPPTNDKALRVHVVNTGKSASAACRLVLTVRKINGIAAGRTTHVNVPALAAGAADWLHIDVKRILPNNVSLQSTTFKLNVDATGLIAEFDEANNEVWHNR